MTLADFLRDDKIKKHTTSALELSNLRAVVKREIEDSAVDKLSRDRQYACAYNAALQLAHMVIACAGYRTNPSKAGHHKISFELVELIIGPSAAPLTAFFEICRIKRNKVDYDSAQVVTETEANEIQMRVQQFQLLVENWITTNHSKYGATP